MTKDAILQSWDKGKAKPVYWLEGEEHFYIDEIVDYAEEKLLTEDEKAFNLTIFYGKDAEWPEILNACRRYPMFSERQVVILKEAQHMKEIEKLDSYIQSPLSSTILIVAYKHKGFSKVKKFYKLLKEKAEIFSSALVKDDKIHAWIVDAALREGLKIKLKAALLLEEHIGNDLSRLQNEIKKLAINVGAKGEIDEDDIEKYIGISKEYNVFELQDAIAHKNMVKGLQIINYFEANPKAGPIQLALPVLYNHFSRVYAAFALKDKSDGALKSMFYFNVQSTQQAKLIMKNYGYAGTEKLLLLLHHYNLKSIGIGSSGATDAQLMKEMLAKMMM